jgi:hypothetical protein
VRALPQPALRPALHPLARGQRGRGAALGAGAVPLSEEGLHPAEHRALRELHATGRQLASHWARLADRLGGPPAGPLREGAATVRGVVRELEGETAERGLHGFPAAQSVGHSLARLRNGAADVVLERNQALRLAVLDADHVLTLLLYLEALADGRDDKALAAVHRRWSGRIEPARDALRDAVVAMAGRPEDALRPAEPSLLGRAGQGAANVVGTLGEAFDGSALGRAARRVARR